MTNPNDVQALAEDERALRAALATGAPEPTETMREALASFRARLPRHPTIRRMERGSFWYWLFAARRTLRWAALTLLFVLFCASLTATGRAVMVRSVGVTFGMINGFVACRVNAGYDTYQLFQRWRKLPSLDLKKGNLGIYGFYGLDRDSRMVLVVNGSTYGSLALWRVDPANGHYEVLHDKIGRHAISGSVSPEVKPLTSPRKDGKLEGLIYITPNCGMTDVIRATLTGVNRTERLWFHDLKDGPKLIDEGTNFHIYSISSDRKKICYKKTNPDGPDPIYLYDLQSSELRMLFTEGMEIPLAFGPRGDSLIILDRLYVKPGVDPAITGIRQVTLDQGLTLARLDFPPNRRFMGDLRDDHSVFIVHENLDAPRKSTAGVIIDDKMSESEKEALTRAHAEQQRLIDCRTDRITFDPLRRSVAPPFLNVFNNQEVVALDHTNFSPIAPTWSFLSPDRHKIAGVEIVTKDNKVRDHRLVVQTLANGAIEPIESLRGRLLGWLDNERLLIQEVRSAAIPDSASEPGLTMGILNIRTRERKLVIVNTNENFDKSHSMFR